MELVARELGCGNPTAGAGPTSGRLAGCPTPGQGHHASPGGEPPKYVDRTHELLVTRAWHEPNQWAGVRFSPWSIGAQDPRGAHPATGLPFHLCSWTRKLGTPYGPGPSTGTSQRNNRDPPPAYDTQRRYRRARVSASSLDGDSTWCTTHATANKPPTNEDAQTCGPGAGFALGLGGISSDGLGVTGRVCDAASPHGCRHASPEHPGMPGDSDTCAANIEYCPSLETRR